jgi:four helix bundle protein
MKVRDYKDLKVWQKGMVITEKIYSATDQYPKQELYTLTSQMRRSAISIPSNIAEGFMRRHTNEYRQFLYVSLASCAELETQIIISHRRNYLSNEMTQDFLEDLNHQMRMLMKLVNRLRDNLFRVTSHESQATKTGGSK